MQKAKKAFIFPGQGESHSVGMAKDFYDQFDIAKQTIDEACDLLGYDLKQLIFEGPLEKLSETKYCQVAIYVVSMAVLRVIRQEFPELVPDYCAGLSLGEYSAAVAASTLTFSQGVQLIHARGTYMQKACQDHPGTMAVVLGFAEEQVMKVINEVNMPHALWMANLNCPGQIVVSGTHAGIEAFMIKGKEAGAKRILPLNVAGAFHSPLMQEAASELTKLLNEMELRKPSAGFLMNATGDLVADISDIKKNLILQITSPVRWQASIERMVSLGVESFFEIGCGKVLSGLNKRMDLAGQTCCINSVKDLELLKNLQPATT